MPLKPEKFIWMNGTLVPWEDAAVHVMSCALHMGASVFEGIRCYRTHLGPALFRGTEHVRRLNDSARIHGWELPYDAATLLEGCREVVRENGLESAYLRPLAWLGVGDLGTDPTDKPVELMIGAVRWEAYLGADGLSRGVDVGVSSWRRMAPGTQPSMAKAGGNYLTSMLIRREARRHGYAEGIALDAFGFVSEGSSENLFVIRDGVIYTPPVSAAILPGITRDTVATLARDLGYEVREQPILREALYVADELFFTGTAAEVVPIRSVDGTTIGTGMRGPVTAHLQDAFFGLFTGETEDRRGWLEPIAAPSAIHVDAAGLVPAAA